MKAKNQKLPAFKIPKGDVASLPTRTATIKAEPPEPVALYINGERVEGQFVMLRKIDKYTIKPL